MQLKQFCFSNLLPYLSEACGCILTRRHGRHSPVVDVDFFAPHTSKEWENRLFCNSDSFDCQIYLVRTTFPIQSWLPYLSRACGCIITRRHGLHSPVVEVDFLPLLSSLQTLEDEVVRKISCFEIPIDCCSPREACGHNISLKNSAEYLGTARTPDAYIFALIIYLFASVLLTE